MIRLLMTGVFVVHPRRAPFAAKLFLEMIFLVSGSVKDTQNQQNTVVTVTIIDVETNRGNATNASSCPITAFPAIRK
jgi:hypothetical protein